MADPTREINRLGDLRGERFDLRRAVHKTSALGGVVHSMEDCNYLMPILLDIAEAAQREVHLDPMEETEEWTKASVALIRTLDALKSLTGGSDA